MLKLIEGYLLFTPQKGNIRIGYEDFFNESIKQIINN